MSENQEVTYRVWQPSVITVKYPESEDDYHGNVIIGPNISKAEIDTRIGGSGEQFINEIDGEGDSWASAIQEGLTKFIQFSETMSDTIPDLRQALYAEFGEPYISVIQFTLDLSLLDYGELV